MNLIRSWGRPETRKREVGICHGEAMPPRDCILWSLHKGWCWVWLLLGVLALAGTIGGCTSSAHGLDRVAASGVLRVALDPSFPPFESVDADGNLQGLDVDLAREIAGRLDLQVHFVTTGYDALYDALAVGRADIILSALYPDPSRTAGYVFSQPYFDAGEVVLVTRESPITGLQDLAGHTVACVFGTAGHMAVLEWQDTWREPPELMVVSSVITVPHLVETGVVDAAIVDRVSALVALSEDGDLRILESSVTEEPYVVAARRQDATLIEAVDRVLEAMFDDGTITRLIQRWMRAETIPSSF